MDLQNEERKFHELLVDELLGIAPETWRAIQLQITASDAANDWSLALELSNPDGADDPVLPTVEMLNAANELANLYRRFGRPWRRVNIVLREGAAGRLQLNVQYEYP